MKKFLLLSCVILLCTSLCRAQDYIRYQRYFNSIDRDVKSKDLDKACRVLDTVDRQYSFVFAKHCMMALQICCAHNDSTRAAIWLKRAFVQGVPAWIIRQDTFTQKCMAYTNAQPVWNEYGHFRRLYQSSIDTALSSRICQLMKQDMRYTNKVNNGFFLFRHTLYGLQWIHNNTVLHRTVKSIIETRGFPGERLIGLPPEIEDSAAYGKMARREGPALVLGEGRAYFMLLHYFSTARNHINPLLFGNVINGNLPVMEYAKISDYQYLNSKHRKRDSCYYTHSEPTETSTIVNLRRDKIGLLPYEQQKENMEQYWIRRRAGTTSREIMYE